MMHAEYFRKIMTKNGDCLRDGEVDTIIRKADLDGEGVIYYEEFLQVRGKISSISSESLQTQILPKAWGLV